MVSTSLIGVGSLGTVIADLAAGGGSPVELLGSGVADQPVTGDAVVLAAPHPAVAGVPMHVVAAGGLGLV